MWQMPGMLNRLNPNSNPNANPTPKPIRYSAFQAFATFGTPSRSLVPIYLLLFLLPGRCQLGGRAISHHLLVHDTSGHGLVLLWKISAVCYVPVLPVLWMTSFSHNGANGPESKTTCTGMFRRGRHVAAQRAKLLSTVAVLTNLTS